MILLKNLKKIIFTFLRLVFYSYFISNNRKKKFTLDIKKFQFFLKKRINFSFSRFSDGELFVLQNKKLIISKNFWILENKKRKAKFSESERKTFLPSKHQFYRKKLLESLKFEKKNYFKGISCKCCNGLGDYNYMIGLVKSHKELTFSNLLQNGNYPTYIKKILPLFKKKKVILIVNKSATITSLPFDVKKRFNIGKNFFIKKNKIIKKIKNYIKKNSIRNHVFLISASSLSNLIIFELYKKFDDNTYIDIGSTLNYYFTHRKKNQSRSYLEEYWNNKRVIQFQNRYCYW